MNRHQRRADAAKSRVSARHIAIRDALTVIRALNDPTITGATLVLPDGEVLHLDASATTSDRDAGEAVH